MIDPSTAKLQVKRGYAASPERVFDAWINPETARHWLFATEGGEIVRAVADARAGGQFSVVDRRDGEDMEHVGAYLEVERPNRLVFTFGVPKNSPDFDRITVEIVRLDRAAN